MNNLMDTILPGDKPLNDDELMNLLIKVRSGELSPEEAERLLSSLPELERESGPTAYEPAPQRIYVRSESVDPSQGYTSSAPLGEARRGTLIVDTLAADFSIDAAKLEDDIFRARYNGSFPSIWVEGNTVTARFNYFSLGALREWLSQQQGDHPRAEFSLNTLIPWQVELHSHMSNLNINLSGVQFSGLKGNGSMNNIILSLDAPVGHIQLHYDGIASAFELRCPAQVPLRVEVLGNTNAADIDGQKFASKSRWQTPGYETAPDRYSIVFSGEASSLSITHP